MSVPPTRKHTRMDELYLAAHATMLEEDNSTAVQQLHRPAMDMRNMPTGRGIGYFGGSSESFTQIPTPSNKSELELFWLLESANLLNYFGTFLNFGGDDVRQLSDADEEEFLEIMNLVGMTKKPLHVRRLQKALHEWRECRDSHQSSTNFINPFRRHQPSNPLLEHPAARVSNVTNAIPPDSPPPTARQACVTRFSSSYESPSSNPTASPARSTQSASDNQQYPALYPEFFNAPKRPKLRDNLLTSQANSEQSPCKSDDSDK